jgi:hypothetical protein
MSADASTSPGTRPTFAKSARKAARSSANAIHDFAGEYSRAQRAAALADADHRHPDGIRELYLQSASLPRIPGADAMFAGGSDEDTKAMRQVAVVFKLAGIAVFLGLIGTIALTS